MYNKQLKKIVLLLIIGSFAVASSAQTVPETLLKIGVNPYTIKDKAALEVESTTKGFLLPRMTKQQRDDIGTTPPVGLQVWCTDCDGTTVPASGQLCVYMGAYWAPIKLVVPSCSLTTGTSPVRVSDTSAKISGTMVEVTAGNLPIETGIVWKEIINDDYASLPFLDATGAPTAPVYKTAGTNVTTANTTFSITIPILISTKSNTMPYYFRTYARTATGIEYGNPIIFSCYRGAICDGTVPTTVAPIVSAVTSRTWMDRNLGAYQAASAYDDYKANGCLYQWGRGNDGHASVTWTSSTTATLSTTTSTQSATDTPGNALFVTSTSYGYDWRSSKNDNLWQGINGINNPCPLLYRIPTGAEFVAETGITNPATAYSVLKLPFATVRWHNGLISQGNSGAYWTSTPSVITSGYSMYFSTISPANILSNSRNYGLSVRCIKN